MLSLKIGSSIIASTITSSTFTFTIGTAPVPAAGAYDSATKVTSLNPGANLALGTTYKATIRGGTRG